MTASQDNSRPRGARLLLATHPVISFFALAYAISWPFFVLSHFPDSPLRTVLIAVGGFGPMLAAAIVIRSAAGSITEWLRGLLHWRVSVGYYVYALGLPVLIMAVMNVALAFLGERPDWSQLPDRIPPYLLTFVLTALIFGGQEEPAWRGFALPRLEDRRSPMVATLILGLGWGIWHVPLYGPAGFVVPLVLAFFYTWLYNKTRSILLCVLLHASFTPAQDHLLLTADSFTVDAVLFASYVLAAAVLIVVTRGRLGLMQTPAPSPAETRRDEQGGPRS
jgi:membrane protease YdiL (CAAX protease family)